MTMEEARAYFSEDRFATENGITLDELDGEHAVTSMTLSPRHRNAFGGVMGVFYDHLYGVEKAANPKYASACAISALKKTDAEVLIIHSEDDKVVSGAHHFDVLREKLAAAKDLPAEKRAEYEALLTVPPEITSSSRPISASTWWAMVSSESRFSL